MFRYAAFVWNSQNPAQAQATERLAAQLRSSLPRWACEFDQPGVRIYCTGARERDSRTYRLDRDGGVMLGTLFRRTANGTPVPASSNVVLGPGESRRIIETRGRELTTAFWGNYVAVLRGPPAEGVYIYRGPASSLPCFRVTHHGVDVLFSSMEDCVRLNPCSFSLDWEYVTAHLFTNITSDRTGLMEVSQVRPGNCLQLRNGRATKHVYWDAIDMARQEIIEDKERAASDLYTTVKACVHSWASCHDGILHNLSGGLDSSIILACLRDAPTSPSVSCVTDHSPGADSDEREYARRMMATAADFRHIEQLRDSNVKLEGILGAARSPIPQGYIRRVETTRARARLARECNASAIFSGSGGDQLFWQQMSVLAVADFIHQHGLSRGLSRVVYDSAQLEGFSIWRTAKLGFSEAMFRRQRDPVVDALAKRTLIGPRAIEASHVRDENYARAQGELKWIPPGKLWHAYALSFPIDYYDPLAQSDDPEQIAPLLSQPLIEVALRIPSYVLMLGGWDRGLARIAFEKDLPREIVRRRSKGGIEEHTLAILKSNLTFVRQLLLDGLLVREGLLDRAKIEAALSDTPSAVMKGMAEICRHLSTEAWLQMWSGERKQAAA